MGVACDRRQLSKKLPHFVTQGCELCECVWGVVCELCECVGVCGV